MENHAAMKQRQYFTSQQELELVSGACETNCTTWLAVFIYRKEIGMANVTVWGAVVVVVIAHEDCSEASIHLLPLTVVIGSERPTLSTVVIFGQLVKDNHSVGARSRAGFGSFRWTPACPLPDLGLLQFFQTNVAGIDSDSIIDASSQRRIVMGVVESNGNGVAAVVGFVWSVDEGHAMWSRRWCWGSGNEYNIRPARNIVGSITVILVSISVRISDGRALT